MLLNNIIVPSKQLAFPLFDNFGIICGYKCNFSKDKYRFDNVVYYVKKRKRARRFTDSKTLSIINLR